MLTTDEGAAGRTAHTVRMTLRASISLTFIGNAVHAACQWGMLAALAKLGTTEAVGEYSIGLAITAPIMMFANLQLREIQATDSRHEYLFGEYLALRLAMSVFAFVATMVVALAGGYSRGVLSTIAGFGVQRFFQSLADLYYGFMQQQERLDIVAHSLLLKGPVTLLVLLTSYAMSHSVALASISVGLAYGAVWLFFDRPRAASIGSDQRLCPDWNRVRLRELGRLALPMGLMAMLVSLTSTVPQYALQELKGSREVGVFSAVSYVRSAGALAVGAMGQASLVQLSEHFRTGRWRDLTLLVARLVGLSALLGAGLVAVAQFFGRELLTVLYTPEYGTHADEFVVLMFGTAIGFVASILEYGLTAARAFRPRLEIAMVVVAVTTAACAMWIPQSGVRGAAWAVAAGGIANVLCCAVALARSQRAHRRAILSGV